MPQITTKINYLINKKIIICSILFWSINICYTQQSKIDSLKREIKKIEKSKNLSIKDTTYIKLLSLLGYEIQFYNSDSLFLLSNKALNYSKSIKYSKGEVNALANFGDYYSIKGEHTKSINNYKKAITIAKTINDSNLLIEIQNSLSLVYAYQGDYANSLRISLDAIKLAKDTNNKDMLSTIYGNISNLYFSQKDHKEALYYIKKAITINDEVGDPFFSAQSLSNLAAINLDLENFNEASVAIDKSIDFLKKEGILDWLVYAYRVKGNIYLDQKKYKWALHWFEQGKIIHENLNDERELLFLLQSIAEVHFELKKNMISEQYVLSAYEIANKINSNEGLSESAELLYKIYKDKKNYTSALKYHEIFQKTQASMYLDEEKNSLTMLKAKIAYEKQEEALILKNKKALTKKQNYIYLALAILLISILIIVLILKSRRVQEKLNKKLEKQKSVLIKREVQLNESNETKNTLFSIIGHDLRGPIGALQGLLYLLTKGDIKKEKFTEMIPKLTDDVNNIYFTLNNLLSWSQTQMNGSKTIHSKVQLKCLIKENIKLLSEMAENKSISIINTLDDTIITWVDYNQIDVVIRNLINNAIKFTPKNGTVIISAQEKDKFWEVVVKDTGLGMDEKTQKKIFNKSTNISTYGTNNEKGTGIGLSLCKEMVMKNNGTIWVESNLEKGSEFYFTLPKAK